jgi:hypothetical protein
MLMLSRRIHGRAYVEPLCAQVVFSCLEFAPDAPRPSFSIASKSATMDKASRVLAQPVPRSLSESYRARADRGGVPHTTLHHRARGRRSIEEKAQSQQYLAPYEEDALVHFLLQISDLGQPVRIKYIRFLALCVPRQRPETDRLSRASRASRAGRLQHHRQRALYFPL